MDNSKKSCVCLAELEKKEDCIVVTILDDSNFKMEFGRAFSHMATHILENFEWLSCKQEKGILSNSKKRIFYASLDPEKNRMDQVKLKKLCGYLKSDKIYYRFEETQELQRDWISHAMKKCTNPLAPKEMGYKLPVNKFGNVDAFRIFPDGWHETTLTVTQIKKNKIPHYKACIGFDDSRYRVKPIVVNIIPNDFSDREQKYLDELKEKAEKELEKINSIELTQKIVAECLYSINKEAKRKRDIQHNSIDRAYHSFRKEYPAAHYQLHRAKNEKFKLYDLKDEALHLAIDLWNLQPVGYHEFPDANRDMYSLEGYDFHINENISDHCLGKITEEIGAERKRGIPPKKAVMLLKRFVKEYGG